ncbi:survival motor neuron protein-like [Schistocerca gregaria]|uniref:survival motor neuron protein-like n=1 Tax=Schistocerca gregaria TaxID=7010 RepID=UPI00211E3D20|nr:survival motor neuron protein-like [Schistocerca gregaria]
MAVSTQAINEQQKATKMLGPRVRDSNTFASRRSASFSARLSPAPFSAGARGWRTEVGARSTAPDCWLAFLPPPPPARPALLSCHRPASLPPSLPALSPFLPSADPSHDTGYQFPPEFRPSH